MKITAKKYKTTTKKHKTTAKRYKITTKRHKTTTEMQSDYKKILKNTRKWKMNTTRHKMTTCTNKGHRDHFCSFESGCQLKRVELSLWVSVSSLSLSQQTVLYLFFPADITFWVSQGWILALIFYSPHMLHLATSWINGKHSECSRWRTRWLHSARRRHSC